MKNILNYSNMFSGRSVIPGKDFDSLKNQITRLDGLEGEKYSIRRKYCDITGTKLGVANAIAYRGYLDAYARYYFATSCKDVKNFGGFAKLEDGGWIADVCIEDGSIFNASGESGDFLKTNHVLFYNNMHGKIFGSVATSTGNLDRVIISHDNTKKDGTINAVPLVTAIIFAIANMSTDDEEKYSVLSVLKKSILEARKKEDGWEKIIPIICDNIYYIANDSFEKMLAAFLGLPDLHDLKDTFELFDDDLIKNISTKATYVEGSPSVFENIAFSGGYTYENVDIPHASGKTTIGSLFGKYDPDPERIRTPEEKEIIESAAYVDEMVASEEVCYMAEMIQKSSDMKHRMRNFILRGPAGTGKTTMVKQLSRLLNLPAVTFEMSPDTDKLDLTMNAIPAGAESETGDDFETAEEWMKSIPNAVNWAFDPVGSYQQITGKVKEDANADDCEKAVLALYSEKKQKESGKSGFTYVLSSIMKAIKNGWIVEVQEPTICSRPGVLASLNALSDDCQQVSLMNGEIVHRNKDAVMIYTTNTDYEGCYPLNQSQLSRFAIMTIDLPDDEEIIARLEEASGLHDKEKLKRMVDVYNSCKELADQKGVTDGSIDFRALTDWAVAALITKKFYKSGLRMMIEKTTADPELQEQFVSCLDSQFRKNE